MSIALVVLAFVGLGAGVRRWWALAIPGALGGLTAAVLVAIGHGVGDTPIPFAVLIATAATAVGMAVRRRPALRRT